VISWLRTEEIETQLAALEGQPALRALVAVYIFAGLRRAEAVWLKPDDVDLKQRLIRVRAKSAGGVKWQPKTGRNRVVPISDALFAILEAFHATQPKRRGWFFLSPHGGATTSGGSGGGATSGGGGRWDPDNLSTALREANRKAGLGWSCLDFRHTFGSHLAQHGMSLFKIAQLMGNSPEICRRHYAALVPEQMHGEINFFGPDSPPQDPVPTDAGAPSRVSKTDAQASAAHGDGTDGLHREDAPRLRLVR